MPMQINIDHTRIRRLRGVRINLMDTEPCR